MTKKLPRTQAPGWPDIHPYSSTSAWRPSPEDASGARLFAIGDVAPLVGLQSAFIKRALGHSKKLSVFDVERLLLLDEMSETFVPRSRILPYLIGKLDNSKLAPTPSLLNGQKLVICGDAHKLVQQLPSMSIDCVVTSTPYWAVRLYGTPQNIDWADGETCPFGHEQTPEGFVRHSVELLFHLKPKLKSSASVWWNLGDTYHTRTQIRGNAYET